MEATHHERLLTTVEAASLSGYGAGYISRLCKAGEIAGQRQGRQWLIDRADFESFLTRQELRRKERSRSLAEARGAEYRGATSVSAPAIQAISVPGASRVRAHEKAGALYLQRIRPASPVLHVVALGVGIAVVVAAQLFASPRVGGSVRDTMTAYILDSADGLRELAIQTVGSSIDRARVQYEHAEALAQAQIRPDGYAYASVPAVLSPASMTNMVAMNIDVRAPREPKEPEPPQEAYASLAAESTTQWPAAVASAVLSPGKTLSAVDTVGAGAYHGVGYAVLRMTSGVLSAYLGAVEQAAGVGLAFGASTRDAVAGYPEAVDGLFARTAQVLGSSAIEGTHALLDTYAAFIYGSVKTAPVIARVAATGTYELVRGIAKTPVRLFAASQEVYLQTIGFLATAGQQSSATVFSLEYGASYRFIATIVGIRDAEVAFINGSLRHLGIASAYVQSVPAKTQLAAGYLQQYGALARDAVSSVGPRIVEIRSTMAQYPRTLTSAALDAAARLWRGSFMGDGTQ